MYLVTSAEMQAMDRMTIESIGIPGRVLMENAGREAARVFRAHFAAQARKGVGVLAGRGNNGGDGHVIARCLAQAGYPVRVFLAAAPERVAGDAAANLGLLRPLGIPVVEIADEESFGRRREEIRDVAVWVDALFGTGLNAEVRGYFRRLIETINALDRPVLAVDVPSGLSADTGRPCGACIRARITVTFAYPKIGHLVYPGAEYSGRLEVVDIGIPHRVAEQVGPRQVLLTPEEVRRSLPQRAADTHKGRGGHVLVVGGSPGKTGAAVMTALSALRAGAGLATLAMAHSLSPIVASSALETMSAPLPEVAYGVLGQTSRAAAAAQMQGKSCLAIGPGLGQAAETKALVRELVAGGTPPLVIDADGLNAFAGHLDALAGLPVEAVLTPHPGEMARILGTTAAAVQQDRIACARELAVRLRVHVVLKGARSVIARPDGMVCLNPTGNPGMASAGMGDVLTGAIAGLMAQGLRADAAARAAVYLHGAAADGLAVSRGPWGYLAGEVLHALPQALADLIRRTEA
jgi:NAD(P)H-hydrate epimerase